MQISEFNISISPKINSTGTMLFYPIFNYQEKVACIIWKQYTKNPRNLIFSYDFAFRKQTTFEKYDAYLEQDNKNCEVFYYFNSSSSINTYKILFLLPIKVDYLGDTDSRDFFTVCLHHNKSQDIWSHKYAYHIHKVNTVKTRVMEISKATDISIFSLEEKENLWTLLSSNNVDYILLAFNILNLIKT